jgi:uncharacterized membrane protein
MGRRWARWTLRRVGAAIGDNQWLLPAVGAVGGLIFALVVGAFAFTSSFILSAQFQLRTLGPEAPTPVLPLAVSVSLLVAMGSLLIWYISAVMRWFRVDQAVAGVIASERSALRAASRSRRGTSMVTVVPERPDGATDIVAPRSGYLAEFDLESMLEAATKADAMVMITRPLRAGVVENESIGWVSSRSGARLLHSSAFC